MTDEPIIPVIQDLPPTNKVYRVVQVGNIWHVEETTVNAYEGNDVIKYVARTGSKGEAERIARVMSGEK